MGDYSPNIIANSFLSCATHNGDGEYIIFGDRRIKWREFVPRVCRVANALRKTLSLVSSDQSSKGALPPRFMPSKKSPR